LILPVTESVGHFGQLKKPDELSIPGQLARSKSAEVRVASGDLKRPQAF